MATDHFLKLPHAGHHGLEGQCAWKSQAALELSPSASTDTSADARQNIEFSTGEAHTKTARTSAPTPSGPDHKPSIQETGSMAAQPNTRIPSEPQRYARPVPIGEAARKVLAELARQMSE